MEGNDPELIAFFDDRIRDFTRDIRGFKYDEVNAAVRVGKSDLKDLEQRLKRIQSLRISPDFEPVAASAKRMANILEQAHFQPGFEWNFNSETVGRQAPEKASGHDYLRFKAGQPIESHDNN